MKIVCEKAELIEGIQRVQNVVSQRAALPILSHILMEAGKDKLQLCATDLEVGIRCSVSADVQEEGTITVPGRTISDIVREAPEEKIEIVTEKGNSVTISCGKSFFKIMGLPKEEFPKLPESGGEESFCIPQKKIKELIRKTLFAVSRDETRYALGGVLFHVKKKEITAVATDGRRLAKVRREKGKDGKIEKELILPAKAVSEINRLMEDTEEEVKVSIGKNEVTFEFNEIIFMARFLKGKFPEYENVIPKTHNIKLSMNREEFLSAIRRVSLLASEKSNSVKLNLYPKKVVLTASTPELGEASEEMDVSYDGEEEVMAFNPAFLMDFLRNETCEEIYFYIINPVSPAMLRPKDEEDYLYVIMPIKI
jgi:DNA polymerase-3 subunit beta